MSSASSGNNPYYPGPNSREGQNTRTATAQGEREGVAAEQAVAAQGYSSAPAGYNNHNSSQLPSPLSPPSEVDAATAPPAAASHLRPREPYGLPPPQRRPVPQVPYSAPARGAYYSEQQQYEPQYSGPQPAVNEPVPLQMPMPHRPIAAAGPSRLPRVEENQSPPLSIYDEQPMQGNNRWRRTINHTQRAAYVEYRRRETIECLLNCVVCFFCCWCLGLVSLFYNLQASWDAGEQQYVRAVEGLNSARKWMYITLITGIILIIINAALS